MKIYKDKELTQEIDSLDLGIVTAGTTEDFNYYVINDSKAYLQNIEFSVDNKELTIASAPKTLKSEEVQDLIVRWSPSVTLKQGLKATLKIEAVELWS